MIDLNDFPENELELMVFSDSEPELEYLPKPKSLEIDMFLRVCTDKFDISKKEIRYKSNDRSGISLLQLKGCLDLNLMTRLRSHPLKLLLNFFLGYLLKISPILPLSWAGCRL